MTKLAETSSGPSFSRLFDLRTVERHILAIRFDIGAVEGGAHVAFVGLLARVLAEGVVEAAEVRKVGHVVHQALHPRVERRLARLRRHCLRRSSISLADLDQHADQMRDVAARVVDVRLQQHRVARRLVDLDVEAVGQQALELRAVETGGAAHQRHARRIEVELVLAHGFDDVGPGRAGLEVVDEAGLAELRRDHLVGAEHAGSTSRSAGDD